MEAIASVAANTCPNEYGLSLTYHIAHVDVRAFACVRVVLCVYVYANACTCANARSHLFRLNDNRIELRFLSSSLFLIVNFMEIFISLYF